MGPGAGKHVSPWQPQAVLPQLATSCTGAAATPSPGVCPGLSMGRAWTVSSVLASRCVILSKLLAPVSPRGRRCVARILPSPSYFSPPRCL